jgi:hypothetical protein
VRAGGGSVYEFAFLPGLAYVHPALRARQQLVDTQDAGGPALDEETAGMLARSVNPWEFPAEVRELILAPVRDAAVRAPLRCDRPLVEATAMRCPQGLVVPLSNYTLRPIDSLALSVDVPAPVTRVASVHHGELAFEREGDTAVSFRLPLDSTDFVMITCGD